MPTHPWKADKWFSSPWNYLPEVAGNLVGAFGYNTLGIPIAAGLLYPFFGVLLSPMLAGAATAFSSVTVVSNANRLRRWSPSLPARTPTSTDRR